MSQTLEGRKEARLAELMAIGSARRGQLSQQYYTHKNKGGRTVKTGPYYVWQRYINGKKHSVRIRPEQVEQVKADLRTGRDVQAVFDDLFSIFEESASVQDQDSKKKPRLSRLPVTRKQTLPSR